MGDKIVLNKCRGDCVPSEEAMKLVCERAGREISVDDLDQMDPVFVQVVEELGNRANGQNTEMYVETIPTDHARFWAWRVQEEAGVKILVLDNRLVDAKLAEEKLKRTVKSLQKHNAAMKKEISAMKKEISAMKKEIAGLPKTKASADA
jgi:hypothetical protein